MAISAFSQAAGRGSFFGAKFDNYIYRGDGNDIIYGSMDRDSISSGAGNDAFVLNAGDNWADGGSGRDTIYSGIGRDTVDGGEGIDTVSYELARSGVTVNLLKGFADAGYGDRDTIFNVENISGSRHADDLSGDMGENLIQGGIGDDTIFGGYGDDRLYGGADDDLLMGGGGNDTLDGGAGVDTASWAESRILGNVSVDMRTGRAVQGAEIGGTDIIRNIENIIATAYDDYVQGNDVSNVIEGGSGNDTVHGAGGNDRLILGSGSDLGDGGDGTDFLNGGSGNDMLYGGNGHDWIHGGSGRDVISGGRGNDILFGESGADVFVFAASALARKNPTYGTGHDEIRDFDFAEGDRIDLRHHYAVDGFADILSGASSDGNDLILRLGSDEIRIEGLALSDLQTAMFIF